PWHQRISPRTIFGRCSRFCSSVPYFSSAGPSIQIPKESSGLRQPRARISEARMLASAADSPPPPYSRGQVGAGQPRSAMRSSQRRCASDLNVHFRPPQQRSESSLMGCRISGGQLASSHARVSRRKSASEVISACLRDALGCLTFTKIPDHTGVNMRIDFQGRVAIVTGAGGGLGREHALALAARGAKVVVNDFGGATDGTGGSSERAEAVAREIREAGGEAIANGASVTDVAAVEAMVAQAMDTWGRVDILVNNAGILRDKTFAKMSLEDFRYVVDVHLMGSVN